jgi:hypothetical protein
VLVPPNSRPSLKCAQTGKELLESDGTVIPGVGIEMFVVQGERVAVESGPSAIAFLNRHPDAVTQGAEVPTLVRENMLMAEEITHLRATVIALEESGKLSTKKLASLAPLYQQASEDVKSAGMEVRRLRSRVQTLKDNLDLERNRPPADDPEALAMFWWISASPFEVTRAYLSPLFREEHGGFRESIRAGMREHPLGKE